MQLKKVIFAAAAAVFVSAIGLADNTKYALCVGINKYSDDYGASSLHGCVNDAVVFAANLKTLGGWTDAGTVRLLDSSATREAIRAAIADVAAKAVAGDTFVYQHSSHGGSVEDDVGNYTANVYLCAHDADYWDYELAEDLELFPSGVKVVVVVDACHSGGLFKGARSRGAKAAKRPFDLAQRVTAIMDASRARRLARGEKGAAKKLASSEIGWVTAAEYNETSIDWGFYDTNEWLTDPDAEGDIRSGTFLGSFTWSWWNGSADTAKDGDNDGKFDAYEGWSSAKAFCIKLDDFWDEEDDSFTPQFLNEGVLRSVELGVCEPLDITTLAPANDNFADATVIKGESGSEKGANLFATREDDEPEHNKGEETGSVWWRWKAPADGTVAFDTEGSTFDTVMAVYTNSTLDTLGLVTANDDEDEDVYTSRCVFDAVAGTTYHVAVAGYASEDYYGYEYDEGDIVLNWELFGPNAVPSAPKRISASTNNVNGVLVRWSAALAATSYTVFRADAEDGAKTELGSTDKAEWLDGTVVPGTEYWYWVVASNGNGASDYAGPEIGQRPTPPANDNFADATGLSGASGSEYGSNLYATREEGEPWHYHKDDEEDCETSTVWWRWIAPADGMFAFDTDGSDFDTVMAVYTGDSLGSLKKVDSDDDGGFGWRTSCCSFRAAGGTVYYIAVAGYGSQTGDIVLNWGVKATTPLVAPSPGEAFALPAAMTGVEYLDSDGDTVYLGFSGGTPFVDEDGDKYFRYEIVEGAFPESMRTGGNWYNEDASWIYIGGTPSDDEAGDYAFTIRVTDATGTSVEQAFTLSVVQNPNQAPVIDSWSPATYDDGYGYTPFIIRVGETQTFSVKVSDPDGDDLSITWSVYDDYENEVSGYDGASDYFINFSSDNEGRYYVHATVSDGKRSAKYSWVVKVVPSDAIVIGQEDLSATEWDEYSVQLTATGGTGEYTWALDESQYVNGRIALTGEGVLSVNTKGLVLAAGETCCLTVSVIATDSNGLSSDSQLIGITVVAAPGATYRPIISRRSPAWGKWSDSPVSVFANGTKVFSVEASDPDSMALSYEWHLYPCEYNAEWDDYERKWDSPIDLGNLGTQLDSSFRFTPSGVLDPGIYYLEIDVSDGVWHSWESWFVKIVADPLYTATFDAKGGQGGTTVTLTAGAALTAPTVTLEGYTFAGWQPPVPATMPAADTTYVAQWTKNADLSPATVGDLSSNGGEVAEPPPAYTVKFDKNKGKGKMADVTHEYGAKVTLPKNKFTRKGYVFAGWATKKNGKVAYSDAQKNVDWTLTKDGATQTFYAIWAKPKYTVKFYGWAKGVTGEMDDQSIKFGKSVKLRKNAFERTGYTFKGWATSKKNAKKGKVAYKNKAKVKNLITTGKAVKLYAVWAKKSKKK